MLVETNDNSNPQQGTGGGPVKKKTLSSEAPSRRHKIPPTRKDERKLFVGGLPANITEDEFRAFFQGFGKLVDSVVMFDRETRRSRGFGFVTFEDPEVCRRLLMMGNEGMQNPNPANLVGRLEMQGKICEVKAAEPKESGSRGRPYHRDHKRMSSESNKMPPRMPRVPPFHNHPMYPPPLPMAPLGGSFPPDAHLPMMGFHPPLPPPNNMVPMYYPNYFVPPMFDPMVVPGEQGGQPMSHAMPPFGPPMPIEGPQPGCALVSPVMQPAPPGQLIHQTTEELQNEEESNKSDK